ncbi:HD-GYP domain-containing protein [bacterium]|nr:HD-GYP domain-containing protein [bacterium]
MTDGDSKHIKVSIDQLHPGWLVDRDIMVDHNVLVTAGVTITPKMIESFRRRGIEELEVARDSELAEALRAKDAEDPVTTLLARTGEIYAQHNLELAIPPEVLEDATDQVEGFFTELEMGQEIDMDVARGVVNNLVGIFSSRANLAVKLLDLDSFDRYTYRHSINVGLLMMLVMQDWVDSQQELEDLVFGAVLHDMGKAKVGADIINKPGKLTDAEWELMRMHPIWSAEMLTEAEASPNAIGIALNHHERLDGKGYPEGLGADELNRFARLSAICDVYDALTTKRSYKAKMDFAKAIDIILQGCGAHFDPEVAHEFIRRVGRYPVGTFIKLSTGEIAVVLRTNERAINRPVVSRVVAADGRQIETGEELNLAIRPDLYITQVVAGVQPT